MHALLLIASECACQSLSGMLCRVVQWGCRRRSLCGLGNISCAWVQDALRPVVAAPQGSCSRHCCMLKLGQHKANSLPCAHGFFSFYSLRLLLTTPSHPGVLSTPSLPPAMAFKPPEVCPRFQPLRMLACTFDEST